MSTTMTNQHEAIEFIAQKVQQRFEGEGTGHDWWHIVRVRNLALQIGAQEGADLLITELGALLHDVADHKLHGGDVEAGMQLIEKWLNEAGVADPVKRTVGDIARNVSYKGAHVDDVTLSVEGQVVRDADRLDAMGAIGIARTFAYGGSKNRLIFDPAVSPEMHTSFEGYKSSDAPTINHFYEKLLLLKDRIHTSTALKIAEERHKFMEVYLQRFFQEWEGEDLLKADS